MAGGVFRALTRYLAPGGVAMLARMPALQVGGAETFQNMLRAREDEFIVRTRRIKNAIVCVGMEEECETFRSTRTSSLGDGDERFEPPMEVLD